MNDLENILTEIQQALQDGDPLKQAQACSQAGQVLLARNLYPQAAHYYREASQLYASQGISAQQGLSLNHLGICLVMQGEAPEALTALSEALAALGPDPDPAYRAAVQGNLGLAYGILDDHENAFRAHKAVLEAAEILEDEGLELQALTNLADCRLQQKEYHSAQGFALVALDLAKRLHQIPALMVIEDLLGMIASRLGDLKSAVEHHLQAYQHAQAEGDLLRQGIALANQALALEGLTEMSQAEAAMSRAEEIFDSLNSTYGEKTRRDLVRIRKGLEG